MTDSPAFVRNGRLDILAVNRLGRALYAPLFTPGSPLPVSIARFQFVDPAGPDLFPDRTASLNTAVALLRTEAGRAPHDSELTALIGELVTRSGEFRNARPEHNVRLHHTGSKPFHHLEIGDILLDFDAMALPAQPGLTLTAYSAEPGIPGHDRTAPAVRLGRHRRRTDRRRHTRPPELTDTAGLRQATRSRGPGPADRHLSRCT
ncbi:MmyB family transcriptional regulator [Streptomyces sp. M-16]|uniref:MmyB family transcriptional regulator n=1 Tax=Streptomyces sp. M-16 TaxID=3233040 RepID=UPI003F982530